jgi:hypothetical protein
MSLFKSDMRKLTLLSILMVVFCSFSDLYALMTDSATNSRQDTIKDNQLLYNGKMWRNQYYLVQEDQFLFSRDFLPGSVTMRGRSFSGVMLKYDIFKDELLTPLDGEILQINKEMVDSFSLSFQDKKYSFITLKEDSLKDAKSFFNVLYNGRTALLIRYSKKIDKLSVEGKYDKFYLITRIFLYKGDTPVQVTGKNDLLNFMMDDKTQIKEYMKINKIKVSEKSPESFIPVIRYYDSLKH